MKKYVGVQSWKATHLSTLDIRVEQKGSLVMKKEKLWKTVRVQISAQIISEKGLVRRGSCIKLLCCCRSGPSPNNLSISSQNLRRPKCYTWRIPTRIISFAILVPELGWWPDDGQRTLALHSITVRQLFKFTLDIVLSKIVKIVSQNNKIL